MGHYDAWPSENQVTSSRDLFMGGFRARSVSGAGQPAGTFPG